MINVRIGQDFFNKDTFSLAQRFQDRNQNLIW